MPLSELILPLLIFLARVTDVSMGVVRTILIMRNRRVAAATLGFFEAIVWVLAVGKVATSLDQPALLLAYALGFAGGNFLGLTIERRLALGNQAVRVFTAQGREIVRRLQAMGVHAARFPGEGRAGPVDLLLVNTPRRRAQQIVDLVREADPEAFYFIDDIGETSEPPTPSGWLAWAKKK